MFRFRMSHRHLRRWRRCHAAPATSILGLAGLLLGGKAFGRGGHELAVVAARASYGWHGRDWSAVPASLAERRGRADFSDVPVLDAQKAASFGQEDVASWARRPFVLRGDAALLGMQAGLARERFVEVASRWSVNISFGYSWSIASNGGAGPQKALLREYIESFMHQEWHDGDTRLEPAYAFDRDVDALQQAGLRLPCEMDVPPFLRGLLAYSASSNTPPSFGRIVMLGGAGSAVGWHRHGAAAQMTVHGWKRWLLYPLGRYPPGDGPGGGNSATDWLRVVYPTLKGDDLPLELVQGPGDIVYVPDGWYHAVVNLADTVAVTVQSFECQPELQEPFKRASPEAIRTLRATDPDYLEQLTGAARQHTMHHPENDLHARKLLFYVLADSNPKEAVNIMLEGIERDPFHVPSQFELAKWLEGRARDGDADALAAFKTAMESWRPFLERNTRSLKALWILDRYFTLVGDEENAERYHQRLVELHERGVDR